MSGCPPSSALASPVSHLTKPHPKLCLSCSHPTAMHHLFPHMNSQPCPCQSPPAPILVPFPPPCSLGTRVISGQTRLAAPTLG